MHFTQHANRRLDGDRFGGGVSLPPDLRLVKVLDKVRHEEVWLWHFRGGYLLGVINQAADGPVFVVKTAITDMMFRASQSRNECRYVPLESQSFTVSLVG